MSLDTGLSISNWGKTRHDSHELNATGLLMVLALLYGVVVARYLPIPRAYGLHVALTLPALILLAASHARWATQSIATYAFHTVLSTPFAAKAAGQFLIGDPALREKYVNTRQEAVQRLNAPMRGRDELGVDVYPWDLSLIFAGGLTWNSRPVFQSYSAYTRELLELNQHHLTGASAPGWVLFNILPFDDQFPALSDSISWPELWTRYDVAGEWMGYLVLCRSERPRAYRLVPISQATAKLGEFVRVPAVDDGPIWARINWQPTLAGRAAELLFKPPAMWMKCLTRDRTLSFRMPRGIAQTGFLLSPFVSDTKTFAAVGYQQADWPKAAGSLEIREISVCASETYTDSEPVGNCDSWALHPSYTVEFLRLDLTDG